MPCLADVIFVDLLSVLIFICHFVKTIFTGQAGLLSFPREKKKAKLGKTYRKACRDDVTWAYSFAQRPAEVGGGREMTDLPP